MEAAAPLASATSLASALESPDTSLLDDDDTVDKFDTIALDGGGGENSSPAGTASRTDTCTAEDMHVSGDANESGADCPRRSGGMIHLGQGFPPLPALLREWSHGPDDMDKRDDQPRTTARRTSSGTPIAVAVQNGHGDMDADAIPPPPPPQHPSAPFGSPLWSMLQSSVTAATTTATSGTAATSNAAAVLPAAALDSPPVKAGLAHLDRAIDQHGPAVAKILTNSMCHLRSSIDHIYAIAAPISDAERDFNVGGGIELDITENDLMPGNDDIDPAEEAEAQAEEDEGFIILDNDLLASFYQSEYDDQDDKFEEELLRKHGRGCIPRRGQFATGQGEEADQLLRGGTIRRVRQWMKRRRERCAEAKRERRLSSSDDVCTDDHTVATDVDTHLALDLVRGASPSCTPDPCNKGQYHRIDVANGESDSDCALQKNAKKRTTKSKKKKAKLRGWGRMRAGTDDDSADYQSSSSSDGACSTKKRRKRKKKKTDKKNGPTKAGASSPKTIPTAPEAQIISRGAPAGPIVKPPAAAEARLIGQWDPLSGRYLRYGEDDYLSSSSLANRPRLHSSPAFFLADAATEKIALGDSLTGSILPGAIPSIEPLPDKDSQHKSKKAKVETHKPVDELIRKKKPSPSIDADWVMVPPPPSCKIEPPSEKSIKAVFLSSPALSGQKSAFVDKMAGIHASSRSSVGTALREIFVKSNLKLSIYDVSAADHGMASLTFTSETVYIIVYDLGARNPATHIRRCSDVCDAEKAIKKANRALQVDVEEHLVSLALLIAQSGVRNFTVLPLILAGKTFSHEEELRRLAIMQKVIASASDGIVFSQRLLVDDLNDFDPIKKDIVRAAAVLCDCQLLGKPPSFVEQSRRFILNEKVHCAAKIIPVSKICDNIDGSSFVDMKKILRQLASAGSILYFEGEFVGDYVVVDQKFFLSAAAAVARRQETTQHGDGALNDIPSHLPIITNDDADTLFRSMSFISDALADGSIDMKPDIFTSYMKEVLVMNDIFIPYKTDGATSYFIPSLCNDMPTDDSWSYKSHESWKTTLASSWTFDSSSTTSVMNVISSALLSHFSSVPEDREVTQVMIWRSSFLVHLSPRHTEAIRAGDAGSVTIFGHLASESDTNLSVAMRSTASDKRRFVLSARGQSGGGGRNIWGGGYRSVLSILAKALSKLDGVEQTQETICPDCLASYHPSNAATWTNESLGRIARCETHALCNNGHRVETALICGQEATDALHGSTKNQILNRSASSVSSHLGSVVLVGLYDEQKHVVTRVGSGFIADAKRGLIITAAHVVMDVESALSYAHQPCKAVIGVLPSGDPSAAVYRYFAELLIEDSRTVDACVLRITTKFEQDVCIVEECCNQPEFPVINNTAVLKADLKQLKTTTSREIGEDVRILGYSQSGEGTLPRGGHINRSPDLARGYITRIFRLDDQCVNNSTGELIPREEIIVCCRVIEGMSGGPAINNEGKVLGLLSRSDKADGERCYLVPASELRRLLKRAKAKCSLTPLEIYWRMNSAASGASSISDDPYM